MRQRKRTTIINNMVRHEHRFRAKGVDVGNRTCFVTVGTTSFDDLVRVIDSEEFLGMVAKTFGVVRTRVQIGRGAHVPVLGQEVAPGSGVESGGGDVGTKQKEGEMNVEGPSDEDETEVQAIARSSLEYYRFAPSLKADMESADIVISHAGAGSIMEALRARKPLMVVVNEKLMDNHQWEIADAMKAGNHLLTSTPATLISVCCVVLNCCFSDCALYSSG